MEILEEFVTDINWGPKDPLILWLCWHGETLILTDLGVTFSKRPPKNLNVLDTFDSKGINTSRYLLSVAVGSMDTLDAEIDTLTEAIAAYKKETDIV